jgi:enamine deaminase RidA (YjgF/YER057c/UK114 family)
MEDSTMHDESVSRLDRSHLIGLTGMWALTLLLTVGVVGAQEAVPHFINPPSLTKPNGYTHVVVAPDGHTVYIAGQVALDSTGQIVGAADFNAQADRVFANLRRALASVGGSLSDLVKTTTFITDGKNIVPLREIRLRYLDQAHPPANTLIVISSLARPELLIEIEGVAILRTPIRAVSAGQRDRMDGE